MRRQWTIMKRIAVIVVLVIAAVLGFAAGRLSVSPPAAEATSEPAVNKPPTVLERDVEKEADAEGTAENESQNAEDENQAAEDESQAAASPAEEAEFRQRIDSLLARLEELEARVAELEVEHGPEGLNIVR